MSNATNAAPSSARPSARPSASALVNNMSVRDLLEVIESNTLIARACMHLALNMIQVNIERRRMNQSKDTYNARFEIIVTGQQVSSGHYKHMFVTTEPST